ncbi:uncharacterized protein [Haliotis cracherodii]|uniref:uncharacterized protein n=1 Tax=Haliotis cracherodii TaxID=6455 RepID=UPI0039EBA962
MSNNRCLPSSDQSTGSVFNICRGGDRYSQFEDDDILAHSPPPHEFPVPIKFEPRKSKFHSLQENEKIKDVGQQSYQLQSTECGAPKIILRNPCKISGERLKQQLATSTDSKRVGIDGSSPHGSIEVHPSSVETVQLFQKAHQAEVNRYLSLPNARMFRRGSESSLFQSVASALQLKGDNSVVEPNNSGTMTRTSAEKMSDQMGKKSVTLTTEHEYNEANLSRVSMTSEFNQWLFGGKKKMDVQNKDVNVFSPTSF